MALNAQKRLEQIKKIVDEKNLAKVAYVYFKHVTPVKSGNARNKTSVSNNTVSASYPYAKRLDNGYSKQAPKGMVNPTIEYVQAYIKQQLGK